MAEVRELEPGWYQIDLHFQGVKRVIAVFVFLGREGITLLETGPSSTLPELEAGLAVLGVENEDVQRLVVTHIHLDHAGAAGTLLQRFPNARVFVHRVGAPHLIDPTRLVASAQRIYGDRMSVLWGEVLPCPSDRVIVVDDGDRIELGGGRALRAIATPGHASHHHAFLDLATGSIFAGDVAGIRISGHPYVYPPTPPPDIDLGLWRRSIARLRALQPSRLYIAHFGVIEDPVWHFDDLLARLFLWAGLIGQALEKGIEAAEIAEQLHKLTDEELQHVLGDESLLPSYYLASGSFRMTVDGYIRYFRTHRLWASG